MLLYAVRVIVNKEPVGFYFVRNFDELSIMVDGITDPGSCECLAIRGPSAIVWPNPVDWEMGVGVGEGVSAVEGLTFDDAAPGFLDVITGHANGNWKPVL